MALQSPQLRKLFLSSSTGLSCSNKTLIKKKTVVRSRGSRCCSAIAIDSPSSLAVAEIRWGSTKLQGAREEMEDDVVVVRSDDVGSGFYYAAVFDGHAGTSSVKFLRYIH